MTRRTNTDPSTSAPIDVEKVWRTTAVDYTRFAEEPDLFAQHIERPILVSLLEGLTSRRSLDLGCGSGQYTFDLARRGGQTTGIDNSPDMLAIARHRAVQTDVPVDFVLGDIRAPLPFADGSLDLVFTGTVLHYVEDLEAVFAEIHRVLSPGGKLLISTLHPTTTSLFPTVQDYPKNPLSRSITYFNSARRAYFPPWARGRPDAEAEVDPLECSHHVFEDYFGALTSAGFCVKALHEPKAREELMRLNPDRFSYTRNQPIYLVLLAEKVRGE